MAVLRGWRHRKTKADYPRELLITEGMQGEERLEEEAESGIESCLLCQFGKFLGRIVSGTNTGA